MSKYFYSVYMTCAPPQVFISNAVVFKDWSSGIWYLDHWDANLIHRLTY